MKKMLFYFSVAFGLSFSFLYFFSGGILQKREKPPIEIFESKQDDSPLIEANISEHKIPISSHHKILGGRYYSYDEKTSLVSFEIRFMEMVPVDSSHVLLKDLECIHYYREKKANYENTPSRFVVRSEQGKLKLGKNAEKIEELFLENEVEIEGYENLEPEKDPDVKEESLLFVKTTRLHIFFQTKKLETGERVWLRWKNDKGKEIFFLEGIGLQGDMNLNKLVFLSDVHTRTQAQILAQKDKKNLAIQKIESFSQGKALLEYGKENKIFLLEQEKNVKIQANQASLTCDKAVFELQRGKDTKLQLQKMEAVGNVKFEDKAQDIANTMRSGYFLFKNLPSGESHLFLKENPEISIAAIDSFSILDEESKEKWRKEAKRHRLKTLYISCKDRIEIYKKSSEKGGIEEYFFYEDVILKETSEKIPFLELHCKRAEFLTHIPEEENNRRVPQSFKAYQNTVITHDRGHARGDFFQWQRISKEESRIHLEGNPVLFIENIESQENRITTGFSGLSPEKEKKQTKNSEDLEISAKEPMQLRMLKEKGTRSLSYKTQNNVVVTRYTSKTKDVLGKFYSQKLFVRMSPHPKTKKMGISYLKAQENVQWETKEAKGNAQELLYRESQGENLLTLSQNVFTETQDGKISGNILQYYTEREIFEAFGEPVKLESKEISATGKELRYYKKEDCLEIQGTPAHVWQENGKENSLTAPSITYWRGTEKVSAIKGVELVFTTSGKDFAFLQGLDKKANPESSGKSEKYLLKAQEIHAELNTKEKNIRSFETQGQVFIKKSQNEQNPHSLEAKGNQIRYTNQQGVLHGEPAEIFYDGNSIASKEFVFSTQKKEILCQGPSTITIAQTNTNLKGMEKSDQPLEIFTQGTVVYSQEKKEIQWNEDVLVKRDSDTMKCKKMSVLLEDNKITSLIAYENVEISSQGSIALADQMRWNEKSEQAFLMAHPFVQIRSKDFLMKSPMVWYHIKERRFFTQGKDVQMETIPSHDSKK